MMQVKAKSEKMDNRKKKTCIIWGAGYCGGIALEAYGADMVLCFGDSDARNVGAIRWEKEIISYEKMIEKAKNENIRIIAASEDFSEEMEKRLLEEEISDYDLFRAEYGRVIAEDRIAGIPVLEKNYRGNVAPLEHPELQKFRDIHRGKRIFLVGNAPSLRTEDLDRLYENHEICFAFNGIHKIFGRTKWRPDYYGIVDFYGFLLNRDRLKKIPGTHFLWDIFCPWLNREEAESGDNHFFHYERTGFTTTMPEFSEDITKGVYLGYSSVYDIGLQFAAYMGASEIYLLGIDHNYPNKKGHEGNHFEGYLDPGERRLEFFPLENIQKGYEKDKVELSFQKAKQYANACGLKIYNATRGGHLEVFERVSFDELFDSK